MNVVAFETTQDAAERLHQEASEALRANGMDPSRAAGPLISSVLLDRTMLRAMAVHYLARVAAGAKSENVPHVAQFTPRDQHTNGEAGPITVDTLDKSACPPPVRGDESLSTTDTPRRPASSPRSPRGGADRSGSDAQPKPVRAVREPTKAQASAEAAAWKRSAESVLDSFIINGMPIGDMTMEQVKRIGPKKGVEHYVLAAIETRHKEAADTTIVRKLVKPDDLEVMLLQAKVKAGAAIKR